MLHLLGRVHLTVHLTVHINDTYDGKVATIRAFWYLLAQLSSSHHQMATLGRLDFSRAWAGLGGLHSFPIGVLIGRDHRAFPTLRDSCSSILELVNVAHAMHALTAVSLPSARAPDSYLVSCVFCLLSPEFCLRRIAACFSPFCLILVSAAVTF